MRELNPVQWAVLPLKKYAVFSGRAPRAEYWWFYLATMIAQVSLTIIDEALGEWSPLASLFSLAILVPWLAVTVRRLHDTNRSGWWLLSLVMLISFIVAIAVAGAIDRDAIGTMSGLIIVGGMVAIAAGVALFLFSVLPGSEGPNRYGPDPYGDGSDLEEVFA